MMKKTIEVDDTRARSQLNRISSRLDSMSDRVRDLSVPNKKVSILLDQWVQFNFASEGSKVGGWVPFASGRGRYIPGRGWDTTAKLLQDTATLKHSYHPFYDRKVAGIGSNLPYAKPHNDGEGFLSARRMIPSNKLDVDLINKAAKIILDHVSGGNDAESK